MPTNKGFTLNYKGQNGYISLYPNTTIDQVEDWDLSSCYGPIQVTLYATDWNNNQQTIIVNGTTVNDIVNCIPILSGTQSEMQAQNNAYNLLDPYIGIQSMNNAIQFTCTSSSPAINLTVQLDWEN